VTVVGGDDQDRYWSVMEIMRGKYPVHIFTCSLGSRLFVLGIYRKQYSVCFDIDKYAVCLLLSHICFPQTPLFLSNVLHGPKAHSHSPSLKEDFSLPHHSSLPSTSHSLSENRVINHHGHNPNPNILSRDLEFTVHPFKSQPERHSHATSR